MSIFSVTDVEARKFSGYLDPRYPSGMWTVNATVTGDASGGIMVAQMDLVKATSFRNSQYYSLEQLMATIDVAITQNGVVSISNYDTGGGLTAIRYTVQFLVDSSGAASIAPRDALAFKGLFLGQQNAVSSSGGLSVVLSNDDTQVLSVKAQGYIWSARSTGVEGGPQRPPTGLYVA